jgi:hypothetical protein
LQTPIKIRSNKEGRSKTMSNKSRNNNKKGDESKKGCKIKEH